MNAPLNHPLPLLDLDVLRTFVAIAETGSFTTAANAVFRTPSAVSMQIKKLEDILGRSVFARDARSVTLTTDGEMLLGYARRLLSINREVVSKFIIPDIVGAYYAHPVAWNEIGFGGPAAPRGYVRLDFDRRDPWEASEATPGREAVAWRENQRVGRR